VARACIFCGARPVRQEHVIPQWLRDTLAEMPMHPVRAQVDLRTPGASRSFSTNRVDIRAGAVCDACNSGWMSDFESSTSPILRPLVRGQRRALSVGEQFVIARWATKIAMVTERTMSQPPEADYYTSVERRRLREISELPATTLVRLAAYGGTERVTLLTSNTFRNWYLDEATPLERGLRTTIQAGGMVLQVVSHRVRPRPGSDAVWLAPVEHEWRTLPVHPSRGPMDWPGNSVFGDRELDAFTGVPSDDGGRKASRGDVSGEHG
jgi:hypothetical protein